ncbi:MAG: hypothetical protein JRF50_06635 [Deltaproteobacteria bacterium]|nr:hypothetical protein [Deltaproteobacteria bacterium]
MRWLKKGLLIQPGTFEWMVTYAQNPFVENVENSLYKVHFAGRDRANRARGGYASVDFKDSVKLLYITPEPTIDLGDLGCFDDCGVMPSCIVDSDSKKYMYYTGWKQEVVTPFSFFIGLAISEDGGKTYERYSKAPVLGRTEHDPYLTASPWVTKENGIWRMWYVSGTGWEVVQNDPKSKHYYHIRYAESLDGLNWNPQGLDCIDLRQDEYAIARPVVYQEGCTYKMWYSHRGGWNTYRAGYAESKDGLSWKRMDDTVGIDVSPQGWDSEMICYPFVFKHEARNYMLYNGNGYGKSGCGYAVLVE